MALHLKPQVPPPLPRLHLPDAVPQQAQTARPLVNYDSRLTREHEPFGLVVRAIFLAVLVQQSWFFLSENNLVVIGTTHIVLHNIHLVFHEAGHALLFWAPRLLMVMGGTLGQLLMPLTLAIAFGVRQRNFFAMAVCLWWLGHSVVDCAPYINDSRAMQLELLGGGTGNDQEGHDWNYILGALNWLPYDVRIAHVVLLTGRIIMVGAWLWAFCWVLRYTWPIIRPSKSDNVGQQSR